MCKKSFRQISFFLFLFALCAAILGGCSETGQNSPKGVVARELDLLKNLNEETVQSYFSYHFFSADDTFSEELKQDTMEAMQLFFQNFSYKIQDSELDEDQASVTVSITNIDTQALANDLCRAIIVQSFEQSEKENSSLEFYSGLLKDLLSQTTYELKTTSLVIPLEKIDGIWTIINSSELEDGLVSGLISYLEDPNTVSAEEVVELNLNYFQDMTPQELIAYFNIQDIFSTSSSISDQLDLTFAQKLLENFQYQILSSENDSASALVKVEITNLDLFSVLDSYKQLLLKYAETADAILDTEQERVETMAQLLLEAFESSSDVTTFPVELELKNTGLVWELKNTTDLTDALLGNISEASNEFSETALTTEALSEETEAQTEKSKTTESETELIPVIQPAS